MVGVFEEEPDLAPPVPAPPAHLRPRTLAPPDPDPLALAIEGVKAIAAATNRETTANEVALPIRDMRISYRRAAI